MEIALFKRQELFSIFLDWYWLNKLFRREGLIVTDDIIFHSTLLQLPQILLMESNHQQLSYTLGNWLLLNRDNKGDISLPIWSKFRTFQS